MPYRLYSKRYREDETIMKWLKTNGYRISDENNCLIECNYLCGSLIKSKHIYKPFNGAIVFIVGSMKFPPFER